MRIIYIIIFLVFLTFLPASSAAQALRDFMAGNTALTAKTAPEPKEQETEKTPDEEKQQSNIMAVTQLPDIKLNNNLITKSVFNYFSSPELETAARLYSSGEQNKALELYENLSSEETASEQTRRQAALNAAFMLLQRADYKNALKYTDSALTLNPNDPSAQLLKIWIYSASGSLNGTLKEAENLPFMTADFEYIAASKLAAAQAYFNAGKKKEAMNVFQNLYGTDPYLISHAAYLMGQLSEKNLPAAAALFEQALEHDSNNYMAHKHQADILYKLKKHIEAWQNYASLFILDRNDKAVAKRLKKLSKHLKRPQEEYLFYTKLSEIYTKKPEENSSRQVRVGLFSDYKANLTPITSFQIMTGADFTLTDERMGEVISGEAYTPKTLIFDEQHKGVHIQNKWGAADFSTKNPFVITLKKKGYSFLLKEPKAKDIFAANLGDKELEGSLLVIPSDKGMILINYTTLEDVLPALLMSLTRGIKNTEVLQAAAVALRTELENSLSLTDEAAFDIPDNTPLLSYGGVNMESNFVKEAVKKTEGQVLADPAKKSKELPYLAQAPIYRACSAATENGERNTQTAVNYNFSPFNLFKFMLSNPPKDLASAPQDPTLWSAVKWAYEIPLKDIQARLNSAYKIGRLKYFEPAQTTKYGRVETMRFVGAKKTIEVPFEEANFILAAGTLKAPFFTAVPFKNSVLILGSDTGAGKGLCIDGAFGMARQGKTAEEILNYYYPDLKTTKQWQTKKLLL